MDGYTDSNGQIIINQVPIVVISYPGTIYNGQYIVFFNIASKSIDSEVNIIITAYMYSNSINMSTIPNYPVTIFYIKQLLA